LEGGGVGTRGREGCVRDRGLAAASGCAAWWRRPVARPGGGGVRDRGLAAASGIADWWRRPLRAPLLHLLFHFLTHSSSHSCPHPRKLFRCPRRFICLPSLIHYFSASTLSLVSCRTGSAPAPPPSRRRSPYFRWKPETPPRPITEGIFPCPPIGVEPAFFYQGGGSGPISPSVRRGALLALASSSFPALPSRWGLTASSYSPPSHKQAQFTGGADVTAGRSTAAGWRASNVY
jgi:hypothetical protein